LSKLDTAENFAKAKHAGMKRKDGVTDYFEHIKGVVNRLQNIGITDEEMLCTAWLHDTLEDTSTSFDELAQRFGKEVALLVLSLSKDQTLAKKQKEIQYVKQLKDAPWQAKIIKLCDIASNLKGLKTRSFKN
jgi:(p)ppGpp synthase/HD superfamily hydrolase